jgi:cytochrome c-type biogenesis protein CcmH/NrfF
MDGGPVSAIVRLPEFDKNFGRFVKVFERLEQPLTFLIWGIGACSVFLGIGALKISFRRSSSDSSSSSRRDKDKDRESKDKSRKEKTSQDRKEKDGQ